MYICQVKNVAATLTGNGVNGRKSNMNLADEIQTILTHLMEDDEYFVQAVNVQLRRSPSVILIYTEDQISDIRAMCGKDAAPHLCSVLAFDR